MLEDNSISINKKERLTLKRDKEKMDKVLGGITNMSRTPAALFIVDISHEHIALKEAKRLGISTFGMVDTNSDPNTVDFAIPSNDDATKSIAIITNYITAAIIEGLQERETEKDKMDDNEEENEDGTISLKEEGSDKDAEEKDKEVPRKKASGTRRTPAAKK
jgi:small subunit ribosomal protein S2